MRPSHPWRLEVLGTPTLVRPDGRSLHPEKNALGLLTYLALEGPTTRSRLAGLLWPETLESAARNNLVHLLRRLQRVYGEGLLRVADLVTLEADVHVDVHALLAPTGGHADVINSIESLLDGVEFDGRPELSDWLLAWRERLAVVRTDILTATAQRQENEGDFAGALSTTLRLLDLNAVSEDAYRRLMRLHYLAGNRGAALAAFGRCKAVLEREFSAEPSPETYEVAREVERGAALPSAPAARARLPLSVLRPPTLVGRDDAWAQMEEAWARGQGVVLTGEPGVGKTRLALDFLDAHGGGMRFEGRPGDAGVPYATHARTYRQLLETYPDFDLAPWIREELVRIVPHLGGMSTPISTHEQKLRFWSAKREVLAGAIGRGLRAMVFDDLQFMDQASIEAGSFVFANLGWGQPDAPYRTIHVYRKGEINEQQQAMLRTLLEAGLVTLVELAPLASTAIEEFVRQLALPGSASLASALERFTGGNPLLLLETARNLHETHARTGKFPSELPLPDKASAIISARLARLSATALQAARAAAVLDSDFGLELVAETLRAPLLDVVAAWEELEEAQVMIGERFSHDLVREAVLSLMPESVRRLLSRSAARVLAREGVNPARVARYWQAGGAAKEAAPLLEAAADEALARLRPLEAVAFFTQAAELYEACGEHGAGFEALTRAADTPWRSERVEALEPILERLARLARTSEQRARLEGFRAARALSAGQPDVAEQAARRGLSLLDDAASPRVQAVLRRELLQAQVRLGQPQAAHSTIRDLLTLQSEADDQREQALDDVVVGTAWLWLERYDEAVPALRRAVATFDRLGDAYRTAWAMHGLAVALEHGLIDVSASIRLREDLDARLESAHAPTLYHANLTELGLTFMRLRQYDEALTWLNRAKTYEEQLGEQPTWTHRLLAELYWRLGAYDACGAAVHYALAFPDVRDRGAAWPWLYLGRLYARRGDTSKAREAYANLEASFDREDFPYIRGLLLLGRAGVEAPDDALNSASNALELARSHQLPELETQALTARAYVLLLMNRPEEAQRDSETAVARLPQFAPVEDFAWPLLVHHRVLSALGDQAAEDVLREALSWLEDTATRVPSEFREAFLNEHDTHRALRKLATPRSSDGKHTDS